MKLQFRHTRKLTMLLALLLALSCTVTPLQAEAVLQTGQEQEEALRTKPAEALQETFEREAKEQNDTPLDGEEELSEESLGILEPHRESSIEAEAATNAAEKENNSQQTSEETTPTNGLAQQENHYVLYVEGVQVTTPGWQELTTGKFLIGNNGYVTARMEEANGIWKLYQYNSNTASWDLQKSVWETVAGKDYYFDASGNCTQIYDTVSLQLTVFKNKQIISANNSIYPLRDGRIYYFDSTGIRSGLSEWKKASSTEWYYVNKKGYVSSKLVKAKKTWAYYNYNYTSSQWEKQKNLWKTIEGKKYYFNSNGRCTKIFDPDTKKCKKYKNGKMVTVKNEIYQLQKGRLYYFNSKGIRVTKKGWQKSSSSLYVQIHKKGYVTCKMEKRSGYWRFYNYNYSSEKWQKQKKVWKTVNKKRYYFNGSGKCTRLYDTSTSKCYDFKNGKKTLVKNEIRDIRGKNYYFGPDGVKVTSQGLYLTGSNRLIYVKSNGCVEKEISGELLAYTSSGSKITSCRLRDSHYMCYYNGDGVLTRQIDLNKPMVALTYDDGPSPHTSTILNLLEQTGSTATFFVVGERVSSYPDTLRRACNMKCEIGNHTYNHKILTKIGIPEIQNQVVSTNAAVQSITGISPVVMRPPGGGYNSTVSLTVGMPMILWSIDTLDWKTKNAGLTQAAVLNHIQDGDIVLMHDLYLQTAQASAVIIPELVNRGYQLITISELSDCRGPMAAGAVYRTFR